MDQDTKIKVIVGAVLSLVIMLMVIYGIVVFGGDDRKSSSSEKVSFGAPKLKKKEYEYNKQIDLINEKGYVPAPQETMQEDTLVLEEEQHIKNPFLDDIEENRQTPQTIQKEKKEIVRASSTASIQTKPSYKQVQQQEPVEVAQVQQTPPRRKKRYLSQTDSDNTQSSNSYQVSESIPCKIYGDHKVTNNSKIKARVTKDATINGVAIKRNTIVSGIVRLNQSRVNIRFETIQYQNKTINANMKAYSRDGLEGIYIEGGVGDDVKKDAYDDIIDAASPSTVDNIPVVGDIIKSTTKKQNDRVYVDIPNDYTIYLRK